MKARAPAIPSAAPRPDVSQKQPAALLFSGYVYEMGKQKQWAPLTESFATISLEWKKDDVKQPTMLFYQNNSKKIALSDLKVIENIKIKDTFVRWQHQQTTYGVRFRTNEEGQKFVMAITIPEDIEKDVRTIEMKYGSELITHKVTSSTKLLDILTTVAESKGVSVNKMPVKYQDRNQPLPIYGTVDDLKSFKLEITKLKDVPSNNTPPVATERKYSNDQRSGGIKMNLNDPLWQVFLGVSNLSVEEVSNPQAASVIEMFVQQHGGVQFLRQVNDLKMSPQLADELNTLAGQVHAATSLSPPSSAMSTLERKKRRAPKPPEPPVKQIPPVDKHSPPTQMTKSKSLEQVKTFNKRRAPTPPTSKPPPQFVPPPPPMEPPPDESSSSPVGPLSPKSMNVVCENSLYREKNGADELLEKRELLAGLEEAIEEENEDDGSKCDLQANVKVECAQASDGNEIQTDAISATHSGESDDHVSDIQSNVIDDVDGRKSPDLAELNKNKPESKEEHVLEIEEVKIENDDTGIENKMEGIIENDVEITAPVAVENIYDVVEKETIQIDDEGHEESKDKSKDLKLNDVPDEIIESSDEKSDSSGNIQIDVTEEDVSVEIEKGLEVLKTNNEIVKKAEEIKINKEIVNESEEVKTNKEFEKEEVKTNSEIEKKLEVVKTNDKIDNGIVLESKIDNEEIIIKRSADDQKRVEKIQENIDENIDEMTVESEMKEIVEIDNQSGLGNGKGASSVDSDAKETRFLSKEAVVTNEPIEKLTNEVQLTKEEHRNEEPTEIKASVKDGNPVPESSISDFKPEVERTPKPIKKPPTGLYAKLKARTSQMSNSSSSENVVGSSETPAVTSKPVARTEVGHNVPILKVEVEKVQNEQKQIDNTANNSQTDNTKNDIQAMQSTDHAQPSVTKTSQQPIEFQNADTSSNQNTDKPNNIKRSTSQRAPPPVKPKPKRQISLDIKKTQPTFGRNVSEAPGTRETVPTKHVGSLTFGFAKDKRNESETQKNLGDREHGVRPSQLFNASKMKNTDIVPVKEVLGPDDFVDLRATNL